MADVGVDFDEETTTNSTTPVRLRGDGGDERIGSHSLCVEFGSHRSVVYSHTPAIEKGRKDRARAKKKRFLFFHDILDQLDILTVPCLFWTRGWNGSNS